MTPRARLLVALLSTALCGYLVLGNLLGRVLGDTTYGQLSVFNEVVRLVIDAYVDMLSTGESEQDNETAKAAAWRPFWRCPDMHRRAAPQPTPVAVQKATTIRVLIADDHPLVGRGLAAIINMEDDATVVGEAGDGEEAVAVWKRLSPDVTLMDLRMTKLDGVQAIRQIRAEDPDAGIIVVTTFDHDEDIYAGLRAGAKAYLLKDVDPEELFRCIRAVHAGEAYLQPRVAAKLAQRISA